MKDQSKTKKVLIQELASLKQKIAELEQAKPEPKQAAENSRRESLFCQSIIDNAGDGICVCHDVPEFPYARFTVWNRHMNNITGYTMDEINCQGWYQAVSPDPVMQAKAIARMDRMRQGDNLDQEEWEITRKDGQRRQLLVSTCIVPGGEAGVNMLAVMNDITDRKWTENALRESKEQYRTLVEKASDIVFRTDNSGHFTFVNPAGVRITGYGEEELIGKHYPKMIRPDMRDEAIKFFGRQF
jgi:PAS domain S-box-containing protein